MFRCRPLLPDPESAPASRPSTREGGKGEGRRAGAHVHGVPVFRAEVPSVLGAAVVSERGGGTRRVAPGQAGAPLVLSDSSIKQLNPEDMDEIEKIDY